MQYSVGPKLQELVNVFLLVHSCSLNSSLDHIKEIASKHNFHICQYVYE